MTRSQFILGIALLCVSGTLAFFISFREQESKRVGPQATAANSSAAHPVTPSKRSERSTPLSLSKRKIEKMDPTSYEVSVSDLALQVVAGKIERESRQRLKEMTERYQLSANQRREVFPLLVSHHPDFQNGLIVNGSTARSPGETNLASDLYPLLDLAQQEAYQEALLADNEWWGEIIGQLREDLDGALADGEIDLITEPIDTLPASTDPARDDGESVENEGIDLGDFLDN
ncbi:MAG: hypothetical protein ACI9NQ_001526 [Paracoccaceae bacterium]|jgi:hypothetical protein